MRRLYWILLAMFVLFVDTKKLSPAVMEIVDDDPVYTSVLLEYNRQYVVHMSTYFLSKVEGFSNYAYHDSNGDYAVGYGFKTNNTKDFITKSDANKRLKKKVIALQKYVRDNVKVNISMGQEIALISFAYNVGKSAFVNSSLLSELNNRNYKEAENEFKNWIYKRKKCGTLIKSKGLLSRRNKEILLFNTDRDLIEII